MENRVLKLEWQTQEHEKELERLNEKQTEMSDVLNGILKAITKIQYLAYGATALYVIQQVGILAVLKKLIGF